MWVFESRVPECTAQAAAIYQALMVWADSLMSEVAFGFPRVLMRNYPLCRVICRVHRVFMACCIFVVKSAANLRRETKDESEKLAALGATRYCEKH